jgi:hypothetical protein
MAVKYEILPLFLLVHTEKAGGTLPLESENLGLMDSRARQLFNWVPGTESILCHIDGREAVMRIQIRCFFIPWILFIEGSAWYSADQVIIVVPGKFSNKFKPTGIWNKKIWIRIPNKTFRIRKTADKYCQEIVRQSSQGFYQPLLRIIS